MVSVKIKDGNAAYLQWQEIKRAEKGELSAGSDSGAKFESLLGEQPKGLPALVAAYRLQEKAGAVGFDWPEAAGALAKVREEIGEVEGAMHGERTAELAREIGDLLFASVNLARHLRVDPERELRAALGRFRERFHHIERRLAERGSTPAQASLEEMDALWEEAKSLARANGEATAS